MESEGVKRILKAVVDGVPPVEGCGALDRDYIGDESNDDDNADDYEQG